MQVTPTEHDYFQAALDLHTSIDLLGALESAEIQADGSAVSLIKVETAIEGSLGGIKPQLHCKGGELAEVRSGRAR